jgi:spore coat protein U-like protein
MRDILIRRRRVGLIGFFATAFLLQSAGATTTNITTTFQVSVQLQATCVINSASALIFATSGVLNANVDQSSTIQVACTDTTPYTIGLDAGTGTGASVATRKLTNGSTTIDYTLYSDSNHSAVWGNTPGTDTVAGTGNGVAQNYPVYGRIAPQSSPAPGTYTDTITVTVSY